MNRTHLLGLAALAAASLAASGPAVAHITLAVKQAQVGGSYLATFRVPHGCDGAATTAVSVKIPVGV